MLSLQNNSLNDKRSQGCRATCEKITAFAMHMTPRQNYNIFLLKKYLFSCTPELKFMMNSVGMTDV